MCIRDRRWSSFLLAAAATFSASTFACMSAPMGWNAISPRGNNYCRMLTYQRRHIRLTEQIKQHLARLREAGPEKQVLRARRTRGPKMPKNQKSKKIKPLRPKCRQGQIHWENTTQNLKSPYARPKSYGFHVSLSFGFKRAHMGPSLGQLGPIYPVWANSIA